MKTCVIVDADEMCEDLCSGDYSRSMLLKCVRALEWLCAKTSAIEFAHGRCVQDRLLAKCVCSSKDVYS